MPIKFSELTNKAIADTSHIIGLYADATSATGSSNCIISVNDFAKSVDLRSADNSAVHKAGTEIITGQKTFTIYPVINESYSSSNRDERIVNYWSNVKLANNELLPSESTFAGFHSFDGNNFEYSTVFSRIDDNGTVHSGLWVHHPNGTAAEMRITQSSDGTTTTYAPTPSAGDNSPQIATTNWCYDPTKSTNLVHRTGHEEIDGSKVFNGSLTCNSSVTVNANLRATTQAITTNNTTVATTAFSQALMKKFFSNTQPTLHSLYYNSSGLGSGNITLSEDFTNYDLILTFMTNDSSNHMSCTWHPTWILDHMLKTAPTTVYLALNEGNYWIIENYNRGSSKTFFKSNTENSKIYQIAGVNINGS